MPASRDQVGHRWYHVDARPGEEDDGDFWFCPHCKHQWALTGETAKKVSTDEIDTNPLPKPSKVVKSSVSVSTIDSRALKLYFDSRNEMLDFEALVMRRKPWPAPKGLKLVQLGETDLRLQFVDVHAAIAFARGIGHKVSPNVWPHRIERPRGGGAIDIRINYEPGKNELIAQFHYWGEAEQVAELLRGSPTEQQIEQATRALLGKDGSREIYPTNWTAGRHYTIKEWREAVKKALVAAWT